MPGTANTNMVDILVSDTDELADALDTLGADDVDTDGFRVFVTEVAGAGYFADLDSAVDAYRDAVIGEQSITDYAWDYAADCMGLDGFALDYFDADKFARDLQLGGDVIVAGNGRWLFYGTW